MVNCYLCHKPIKVSTEKHLFDEKLKKRMHIRCFAGPCPVCDKAVQMVDGKVIGIQKGKDVYHKACFKRASLRKNAPLVKDEDIKTAKTGAYAVGAVVAPEITIPVAAADAFLSQKKKPKGNPAGERWLSDAELNPLPAAEMLRQGNVLNPRRNARRHGTAEEQGLSKMAMEVAARAEKEGKDGLEAAISYLQIVTQTPAVEKITQELKREWMFKHRENPKTVIPTDPFGDAAFGAIGAEKFHKDAHKALGQGIDKLVDVENEVLKRNPPKCAGCDEQITKDEFMCCITDNSGCYHPWCYPKMDDVIKASIKGVERNPERPPSEFWDKVYPQVFEGYRKKYREAKAEELARKTTAAIWHHKLDPKKKREYMARENPKADVSKVGTGAPYLLVDSYGQVLERNQGSDVDAETGRLELENRLGRTVKLVRPKDFIKYAEKAKRTVG